MRANTQREVTRRRVANQTEAARRVCGEDESLRSCTQIPKRERLKIRDAHSRKNTLLTGTNLAEEMLQVPLLPHCWGELLIASYQTNTCPACRACSLGPLVMVCCFSPAAAIRLVSWARAVSLRRRRILLKPFIPAFDLGASMYPLRKAMSNAFFAKRVKSFLHSERHCFPSWVAFHIG